MPAGHLPFTGREVPGAMGVPPGAQSGPQLVLDDVVEDATEVLEDVVLVGEAVDEPLDELGGAVVRLLVAEVAGKADVVAGSVCVAFDVPVAVEVAGPVVLSLEDLPPHAHAVRATMAAATAEIARNDRVTEGPRALRARA